MMMTGVCMQSINTATNLHQRIVGSFDHQIHRKQLRAVAHCEILFLRSMRWTGVQVMGYI